MLDKFIFMPVLLPLVHAVDAEGRLECYPEPIRFLGIEVEPNHLHHLVGRAVFERGFQRLAIAPVEGGAEPFSLLDLFEEEIHAPLKSRFSGILFFVRVSFVVFAFRRGCTSLSEDVDSDNVFAF